ncbi:MAG: DUF4870 domain-containing protein [Leptolyngbyaceae cyanobacterium SM1_1_3]|nr:DUF4870 domain-containing protein [Leptolyngbyaceae cyanobacterium SM1_1_3]NJO09043.1 DUF4870 domain-containing protein [Leptolyngbyaceae cyanobacterium SL_1_1]
MLIEQNHKARRWAAICHLSALGMLLFLMFGNILGPLTIWLIKKREFPFIDRHGKEAVNFQISMSIYSVAIVAFAIARLSIEAMLILAVLLIVLNIIFIAIAAFRASHGKSYQYPLTIPFVR